MAGTGCAGCPEQRRGLGLCQGLSLLTDTAGWAALSRGLCLHSNQTSRAAAKKATTLHQLADLRYRSSLLLLLWEQELTCVPWSPDIHPTLGRRGRSITTPWQCLCDPLGAAPVLNALLWSFSSDCGQERFVRRAPSSPWGKGRIMKGAKR